MQPGYLPPGKKKSKKFISEGLWDLHGKKGQNKICENDLLQIKFRFFHGEVNFAPAKKAEFGKSKVLHSCIIGITLMHKQAINFLRKLVTKYNDIRTKELKGWKII